MTAVVFDHDTQIRAVLPPHLRERAQWVCEEFSCDGRIVDALRRREWGPQRRRKPTSAPSPKGDLR